MELKTKQVTLAWSSDLSDFITDQFGLRFNVLDDGEYSQNELVAFDVEKDPDVTEKVQAWLDSPPPENSWSGGLSRPYTSEMLSELANRGVLPEGDLYVNVWW